MLDQARSCNGTGRMQTNQPSSHINEDWLHHLCGTVRRLKQAKRNNTIRIIKKSRKPTTEHHWSKHTNWDRRKIKAIENLKSDPPTNTCPKAEETMNQHSLDQSWMMESREGICNSYPTNKIQNLKNFIEHATSKSKQRRRRRESSPAPPSRSDRHRRGGELPNEDLAAERIREKTLALNRHYFIKA